MYRVLFFLALYLYASSDVNAADSLSHKQDSVSENKAPVSTLTVKKDSIHDTSISKTAQGSQQNPQSYPVILFNDTIININSGDGIWGAKERVDHIKEVVDKLVENETFHPDSLSMEEIEGAVDIYHGDLHLITFTKKDEETFNLPLQVIARKFIYEIEEAYKNRQKDITSRNKWLSWLWIALVVVCLYIIIKILKRTFKRLSEWITVKLDHSIEHGIRLKKVEIISQDKLKALILIAIKWFRIILNIFFIYMAIVMMVRLFPSTQSITNKILDYLLTPIKSIFSVILDFIPNLFYIAIIIGITHYILKFIHLITDQIKKKNLEIPGFYPDWAEPTYKIVRFFVYVIAIVMIFPYLPGSNSPAIKGISIFLGVLFSLGSTSAIANIVGGIVITYMRPYRIGDRVQVAETEGYVIDKTLLVTKVKTIKNEEITIPNSIILSSHIKNYHANHVEEPLILHSRISIGYDVEASKVRELLLNAAGITENILKDPEPFVHQVCLGDYSVVYEVNAFTYEIKMLDRTYSELRKNILDEFNKAEIEIMSPAYSAIRDGNQATVPSNFIAKGYKKPVFELGVIDKLFK